MTSQLTPRPTGQPAQAVALAFCAADALRHLTTLTGRDTAAAGIGRAEDLTHLLGALQVLVGHTVTVLRDTDAWLTAEHDAGRVAVAGGRDAGDPATAVATIHRTLTGLDTVLPAAEAALALLRRLAGRLTTR